MSGFLYVNINEVGSLMADIETTTNGEHSNVLATFKY